MPNEIKFELHSFNELLDAHPSRHKRIIEKMRGNKTLLEFEDEIAIESSRTVREIKNALCRNVEEEHLMRYIQIHQLEAGRLIAQLEEYQKIQDDQVLDEICNLVYGWIIIEVKQVLGYIERNLQKYCNPDLQVSSGYHTDSIEEIRKQRLVLEGKMKSKDMEPALQKIILDYVNEFCLLKFCSCRELSYIKLFMERLLSLLKTQGVEDWNRKVSFELIYLNFNKIDFLIYCRKYIADDVDGQISLEKQRELFLWHKKEIGALLIKDGVGYSLKQLSFIAGLLEYVDLELGYIEAIENTGGTALPVVNFTERIASEAKLKTNFTVPLLAFFMRLLFDVELVPAENGEVADILRFVAANTSTVGTVDVSSEQLIKHLKPGARDRDKMEAIILAILKRLKEY